MPPLLLMFFVVVVSVFCMQRFIKLLFVVWQIVASSSSVLFSRHTTNEQEMSGITQNGNALKPSILNCLFLFCCFFRREFDTKIKVSFWCAQKEIFFFLLLSQFRRILSLEWFHLKNYLEKLHWNNCHGFIFKWTMSDCGFSINFFFFITVMKYFISNCW